MKFGRIVDSLIVGALLLVCAGLAQAQTRVTPCNAATPTNAVCLTGTAPTTRTDGTPITGALSFRWEQRLAPSGTFASIGTQATLQKYVTGLAAGTYEFRAFAIEAGNAESAASNVAGRDSAVSPPNAPIIIIAATIRAGQPPTFRIVYTVTPRADEYVFVAPASLRPAFAR